MKKTFLAIILAVLLAAVPAFAVGPPGSGGSGSGVQTASECNAAAYYAIGTLCQDTDDGKLYKGTGAAVVEIAAGASGDVSKVGTPSNHQWAFWTGNGTLAGVTIAASKPICSDASGDPVICAGTEGVWSATGHTHAVPTTITVADEAADASSFVLFVTAPTGDLGPKTDTAFTYDPTTGTVGATKFAGAFNGTVGATTPAAGKFTTLEASTSLAVTAATTTGGYIRLLEGTDNGTDYSSIVGAANAGSYPSFTFGGSQGSEDLTLTATNNLWTFASSTSATFAFTTAVSFTDDITVVGGDITLAAAGVKLTGSNGALTILGLGDGQDEDVKIDLNTTANTIEITSPASSATTIDINTLNMVSTGQISGRVPVATDADGKTLAGTDLYGSMQMATGAGTWVIPDVDAASGTGLAFCIYSTTAAEIVIDGNAEDKIRLGGTLGAAGGDITNNTAEAAGDFICLMLTDFASDVAHWTVLGKSGTWTVVP